MLMLCASLAELLLPPGSISRFVRLVIGLMLLAAIVVPLTDEISFTSSSSEDDLRLEEAAALYISAGEELSVSLNNAAFDEYAAQLETQIASLVSLVEGVDQAGAQVILNESGELEGVELVLDINAVSTMQVCENIRELLSGFYVLDENKISCIVEESGDEEK